MDKFKTFTKAIMRAGAFRDSAGNERGFSAADLAAIAANYPNAEEGRAPVVFGHPSEEAPAEGWVEKLAVDDTGHLVAEIRPNHAYLLDAVAQKLRPKVSASFFPKDHPANPAPGQWTLRHVGFLGAAAPAVPNLPPANLSAGDDFLTTTLGDSTMPEPTPTPTPTPAPTPPPADFAAQQAKLDAQKAELDAQKADFAAQQNELAKQQEALAAAAAERQEAEITAQVAAWKNDGKMPPASADFAEKLLRGCRQADAAETADFSATAGKQKLGDVFVDFMDSLEKAKLFERMPDGDEPKPQSSAARGRQIASFAADNKLDILEAERQLIDSGKIEKE